MRFLAALSASIVFFAIAAASAFGSYPAFWRHQASCIRYKESRGQLRIVNPKPAPDGEHAKGLYQFLPSTWRAHLPPRAHWPKDPTKATFAQQTFVAWRTWVYDHRSWREWNYECG